MVISRLIAKFESGQDLIEYAITLPIFFFIVLGIFDLGRVIYYYSAMQNAAREGARYGVVHPRDDAQVVNNQIIAMVKNRSLGLDQNEINVSVSWTCELVMVDTDFNFHPVTLFIGNLFSPDGFVNIGTGSELQRERWNAKPGEPDAGCVLWD